MNYSELAQNPSMVDEMYKNFFTADLSDPNFYFIFKKEIFDFFISDPSARKKFPAFWDLNVFGTWKYLKMIDPDSVLDTAPLQVFTAVKQGYNVFEEFVSYLDSAWLPSEETVKIFYNEFRNRFLDIDEKIGNDKTGFPSRDFIKEVGFLSKKGKESPEFSKFKIGVENVLFADIKNKSFRKYVLINKKNAVEGLLDLIDLFNNVGQERIIEKLEEITFEKIGGIKIKDLELKVKRIDEIEPLKISLPVQEVKPKEIVKEEIEKPIEKVEPKTSPAPSYMDIKAKILQFFPKDENGEIIDTEGVFEVLNKTAEKYGDKKIEELYYYNENTGKFEWSI